MIVSHGLGLIFIQAMKTASTSVGVAIWGLCDKRHDYPFRPRTAHYGCDEVRASVRRAVWDRYEKLTVLRNPFDVYVSLYHYQAALFRNPPKRIMPTRRGNKVAAWRIAATQKFPVWLRGWIGGSKGFLNDKFYFDSEGREPIDTYFRYETLGEDWEKWLGHRGIPVRDIPRINAGSRPRHKERDGYRGYYDDGSRRLVERTARRVLDRFGYEF